MGKRVVIKWGSMYVPYIIFKEALKRLVPRPSTEYVAMECYRASDSSRASFSANCSVLQSRRRRGGRSSNQDVVQECFGTGRGRGIRRRGSKEFRNYRQSTIGKTLLHVRVSAKGDAVIIIVNRSLINERCSLVRLLVYLQGQSTRR